ncbi:hypothetical protein BT69DRAFT_1283676 [Atractiella rhizophila]|nr:hypothetical protein BT69DRAFT_1283676 [Atractiella rhizophila]
MERSKLSWDGQASSLVFLQGILLLSKESENSEHSTKSRNTSAGILIIQSKRGRQAGVEWGEIRRWMDRVNESR